MYNIRGGSLEVMVAIMVEDQYPPILELYEYSVSNKEWKEWFNVDTDQMDYIVALAEKYIR